MTDPKTYAVTIEFIESGFVACSQNARQLVDGARLLRENGLHAPALSLSVLALEELGKVYCIDALLFASGNSREHQDFQRSLRDHSLKLSALVFIPLLLGVIASRDARYQVEPAFHQAVALAVADLKERGNKVLSLSNQASFQDLNAWKQSGLYAQPRGTSFVHPAEAVDVEVAEAVHMLAWRAVTTLDFLLRGENLQHYLAFARNIRAKLTDESHEAIKKAALILRDEIFKPN